MTNYLKELVSYRHFNMMDETYIINQIKEKFSFVSLDFVKELERARNPVFDQVSGRHTKPQRITGVPTGQISHPLGILHHQGPVIAPLYAQGLELLWLRIGGQLKEHGVAHDVAHKEDHVGRKNQ